MPITTLNPRPDLDIRWGLGPELRNFATHTKLLFRTNRKKREREVNLNSQAGEKKSPTKHEDGRIRSYNSLCNIRLKLNVFMI